MKQRYRIVILLASFWFLIGCTNCAWCTLTVLQTQIATKLESWLRMSLSREGITWRMQNKEFAARAEQHYLDVVNRHDFWSDQDMLDLLITIERRNLQQCIHLRFTSAMTILLPPEISSRLSQIELELSNFQIADPTDDIDATRPLSVEALSLSYLVPTSIPSPVEEPTPTTLPSLVSGAPLLPPPNPLPIIRSISTNAPHPTVAPGLSTQLMVAPSPSSSLLIMPSAPHR